MKSVSKLLVVAALLASSAGVAAHAQTAAPPPKKPANSTANTAGYTAPGSTEGGPAYVGPIMSEWGRKVTPENARSEEHTSELQSLMRTSYAVFCLQQKTQHKNRTK